MRCVVEMDEHEGFRDSALNAVVMQVFHDAVEEGVNHPLTSRVLYRFLVDGKQASASCMNKGMLISCTAGLGDLLISELLELDTIPPPHGKPKL